MPKLPALAAALILAGQVAACGENPRRAEAAETVRAQLAGEAAARQSAETARETSRPEIRARLAEALAASHSDYAAGPQAGLIEAALRLQESGACHVSDFAEWGWTRSQLPGQAETFITYCTARGALTRHTATPAA